MLRVQASLLIGFALTALVPGGASSRVVTSRGTIVQKDKTQSCSVIDQQQIQRTGTGNIADVLRNVPQVGCTPPNLNSQAASLPPLLEGFDERLLNPQNAERALFGLPSFRWSVGLAQNATDYAVELAFTGQVKHAPRDGRGTERENLEQAPIGWSPEQMIQEWIKEKSFFHPGTFPDVCNGDWTRCAHYTQIIWPTTTDVGCGLAQGHGFNWLVCRYSPGGNKDGQPIGIALRAHQYCTEQSRIDDLLRLQEELIKTDESTSQGRAHGDQIRGAIQNAKSATIEGHACSSAADIPERGPRLGDRPTSIHFFDPKSGDTAEFPDWVTPPSGWKALRPLPRQSSTAPGTTVTWRAGLEPRVYVNPATGEQGWITPGESIPRGWIPLRPIAGCCSTVVQPQSSLVGARAGGGTYLIRQRERLTIFGKVRRYQLAGSRCMICRLCLAQAQE